MILISPKELAKVLTLVVVFLTLASIAGQFFKYFLGHDHVLGLVPLFDLNQEQNIPTWYSSSTLFFCGILLALIAYSKTMQSASYFLHWSVLSIIFFYLSLDEAISIHERTSEPLRSALNVSGFLYYAWVIPGAALVLIFVLAYVKFLIDLPRKTRLQFLVAGTLFVGGALVTEAVSARHADLYGTEDMTYEMITTGEEFLEMIGVVVFIYALLSYLRTYVRDAQVHIGERSGLA